MPNAMLRHAQIQHDLLTVDKDVFHLWFAIDNSRENKPFVIS